MSARYHQAFNAREFDVWREVFDDDVDLTVDGMEFRGVDDGIVGARPDGHGFVGLADRLAALDGQLRVGSPAGGGTLVAAEIPLPG